MINDKVSPPLAKGQWAAIAGLRFLLALCVFFQHVSWVDVSAKQWHDYAGGFSAVLAFLILSGFSIAHSLRAGAQGYYVRRAWRIYPAYLCIIAFAVLIARDITPLTALGSVLMMQQIVFSSSASLGPTWTLGPEWWFYMAAPRLTTAAAAILALISFVYACTTWLHGQFFSALPYGGAILALAWAWLLGFCYYRTRDWRWIVAAVFGYVILNGLASLYVTHNLSTVINAGGVGLILALVAISTTRFTAGAIGDYLGRLSYTLYIAHAAVLLAMQQSAAPWYVCLVAALISAMLLERVEFLIRSLRGGRIFSFG